MKIQIQTFRDISRTGLVWSSRFRSVELFHLLISITFFFFTFASYILWLFCYSFSVSDKNGCRNLSASVNIPIFKINWHAITWKCRKIRWACSFKLFTLDEEIKCKTTSLSCFVGFFFCFYFFFRKEDHKTGTHISSDKSKDRNLNMGYKTKIKTEIWYGSFVLILSIQCLPFTSF